MVFSPEVFVSIIEQKSYTCIKIGPEEIDLPPYLLQGQKEKSYIIKDGEEPQSWYWEGLALVDGKRCLYFDEIGLYPITDLATTRRSDALTLVRSLAKGLQQLSTQFLDLSSNTLPLWRIWGIEDGGFLILNQDLSDLFSACAEEDVRYGMLSAWVHHGIHTPFSLSDQLTQLLYYSAAGFPPFGPQETREDSFRALPLALCCPDLEAKTRTFIDSTLSLNLAKQREYSGNKESQKALSWFVSATSSLHWDLDARTTAPSYEDYQEDALCTSFLARQKNRATRNIFWRKKGWLVITVSLAIILTTWFATGRIKAALAPPYTAGMAAEQIIEEYYKSQNELDLQNMEASLAKKVKNPASLEVTNLFVARQTRQAYEGISTQQDPVTWLAAGSPPIMEGTFLYGVADVNIRSLGNNEYLATGTVYTPYPYFEEQESIMVQVGEVVIFRYKQVQQFRIGESKKGWLEIQDLHTVSLDALPELRIKTYPQGNSTILGMPQ